MPWVTVAGNYMPSAGEHVIVVVSPISIPLTLSETDVRNAVSSAGIAVLDVNKALFGPFEVKLSAPGGKTMDEIGRMVANAIDDLWQAGHTQIVRYEKWQFEVAPPTGLTVSLVAIAVILVVGYILLRQARVI